MAKRIIALAAVLLAGGIGTASAQQQMPQGQLTQGQTAQRQTAQGQTAQGQTRATPPYGQQTGDTAPLGPNINKPKVNPSAAGTVAKGKGTGTSSQANADEDNHEHSGSVGSNANTHPLKALRAGGEPRRRGMSEPSGVYRTPEPTMEPSAGR